MRALAIAALIAAAACGPVILPVGTRVPLAELEPHRGDLDQFIAGAVERGEHARAYFALDLRKTRPYAIQQIRAREQRKPVERDLRDLRPLFARLIAAEAEGRSAQLVAASQRTRQQVNAARDDDYWKHLELFEARVSKLNRETPGIPYSYAARTGFGVSSLEESALLFGPGEAMLSFFVHGDAVWAFLIRDGKLVVKRAAAPTARIQRLSTGLLATLRAAPDEPGDRDWEALAAKTYDALLAPLAADLAGLESLLISPDGFLAGIPFAVLMEPAGRGREPRTAPDNSEPAGRGREPRTAPDNNEPAGRGREPRTAPDNNEPAGTGRRPLVERLRISYIASASIYRQLLDRPILNDPPRLLAVGNAVYPEQLSPLPFAEREAVTVSEIFPGSQLLRGDVALESRVAELAPRFNILHFATHGVLLGKLLPEASSLLVSPEPGRDGFLNAAEIARLDLSSTYVAVLSACETSVAADSARAVDLGTLTNAFLGAGVPSVIGSLWQVSDEGTTVLMLEFYRQFLEVGAGAALQRAMLALHARPRFAHPFYWAPFALYGWDK